MTAPWITYRPEIKVLDCTIRDGGLINEHKFTDDFVRAVYDTCVEAGIDYMEVGYKNSPKLFAREKFGDWKFCEEQDLRRVFGSNDTDLKLAVMADAGGKCDWRQDFLPCKESVIDLVRVACYATQVSEAIEMIQHCHDLGYETCCNIMAISTVSDEEIDQALLVLRETPAQTVVVVDSYGSLYQEQVARLVNKYREALDGTGKEIGIHTHNNQQLAFANTIESIIRGATRIDATMAGLGRGAGNCCMELLLGFLRNPKFRIRPVWKLLQEQFPELRRTLDWGPHTAYIIAGQMNQHPRAAMAWREAANREDCLDFYDKCAQDL